MTLAFDNGDWAVFDRLHDNEIPVTSDLQHGEAVELAREMSENFGPLLREGQPTNRYYAALDGRKITRRIFDAMKEK